MHNNEKIEFEYELTGAGWARYSFSTNEKPFSNSDERLYYSDYEKELAILAMEM